MATDNSISSSTPVAACSATSAKARRNKNKRNNKGKSNASSRGIGKSDGAAEPLSSSTAHDSITARTASNTDTEDDKKKLGSLLQEQREKYNIKNDVDNSRATTATTTSHSTHAGSRNATRPQSNNPNYMISNNNNTLHDQQQLHAQHIAASSKSRLLEIEEQSLGGSSVEDELMATTTMNGGYHEIDGGRDAGGEQVVIGGSKSNTSESTMRDVFEALPPEMRRRPSVQKMFQTFLATDNSSYPSSREPSHSGRRSSCGDRFATPESVEKMPKKDFTEDEDEDRPRALLGETFVTSNRDSRASSVLTISTAINCECHESDLGSSFLGSSFELNHPGNCSRGSGSLSRTSSVPSNPVPNPATTSSIVPVPSPSAGKPPPPPVRTQGSASQDSSGMWWNGRSSNHNTDQEAYYNGKYQASRDHVQAKVRHLPRIQPSAPPAARVSQSNRFYPNRSRNNDWSLVTTSSGHVPDFAAISSNVVSISKLMESIMAEEKQKQECTSSSCGRDSERDEDKQEDPKKDTVESASMSSIENKAPTSVASTTSRASCSTHDDFLSSSSCSTTVEEIFPVSSRISNVSEATTSLWEQATLPVVPTAAPAPCGGNPGSGPAMGHSRGYQQRSGRAPPAWYSCNSSSNHSRNTTRQPEHMVEQHAPERAGLEDQEQHLHPNKHNINAPVRGHGVLARGRNHPAQYGAWGGRENTTEPESYYPYPQDQIFNPALHFDMIAAQLSGAAASQMHADGVVHAGAAHLPPPPGLSQVCWPPECWGWPEPFYQEAWAYGEQSRSSPETCAAAVVSCASTTQQGVKNDLDDQQEPEVAYEERLAQIIEKRQDTPETYFYAVRAGLFDQTPKH
ncbi:unnamed protein product [Amoebophrya sp. A25]|nr:unnamed protein product [Amoebophrya sp. A25]|eukprot:GSA25T00006362001.1